MDKKMQALVNNYKKWVEKDLIYKMWEDEDYENTMVYENINGDVIAIERDENGNIIGAYEN